MNESNATNPYAPPAPEKEPDSTIVLGRNEACRVVGKKLYCRRGLERFPNICWLTGSTDELVGTHSTKGRYLPKRASQLYAIAFCLWIIVLMGMDLSWPPFTAGATLLFIGDSVLRRTFGRSFEFVVGETQVARKHRASNWRFGLWSSAIATVTAAATVYSVYWLDFAFLFVVPFVVIGFGIFYLMKRPRFFSATINEHSDNVLAIQGLTKEFLEALQRKDVY